MAGVAAAGWVVFVRLGPETREPPLTGSTGPPVVTTQPTANIEPTAAAANHLNSVSFILSFSSILRRASPTSFVRPGASGADRPLDGQGDRRIHSTSHLRRSVARSSLARRGHEVSAAPADPLSGVPGRRWGLSGRADVLTEQRPARRGDDRRRAGQGALADDLRLCGLAEKRYPDAQGSSTSRRGDRFWQLARRGVAHRSTLADAPTRGATRSRSNFVYRRATMKPRYAGRSS